MFKVPLALMWHQHQPYYPDDIAGENSMPWVRLHGTKDYLGMALHLDEVPEFRCTINLVPSLLVQLQAYVRGATDRHLDLSRMPADGLTRADAIYILDHFFMAHADAMIRPHPRYAELLYLRALGTETAEQAVARFRPQDLRDLQVWSNLAWIHPILFERDAELAELLAKDRRYSEEEKNRLLDKQRSLLAQIIPLHRALAERGQVELTTSPFYHPILPLLLDARLAREALPDVNLPHHKDGYPADAEAQIERGIATHREHLGSAPVGMWPSEGSVCQAMIPLLARHSIQWIASDEQILSQSTHGRVGRDGAGHLRHPELLYRPWKLHEDGHDLAIVFRDHALSDQIGFHYQRTPGPAAAADFLGKLHAIGHACRHNSGMLVPVILDGENCWEYYRDGGVSFLRTLYHEAVRDPRISPVTIGEHLRHHPPHQSIPRLFAGSWIHHNFAIWVGHDEDNRAWDALHATRGFLERATHEGHQSADVLRRAWEEIYIAEGSDWFWWYGDDHSSALDAQFDDLFRKHLRNVFDLLGHPPPGFLFSPISRAATRLHVREQPIAFLDVKVDGRSSYFEWINAVRCVCRNERGTMNQVSQGLLRQVFYGFSVDRLMIRLDTTDGPARDRLAAADLLRITFVDPPGWEIRVRDPAQGHPLATLFHEDNPSCNGTTVEVATDRILELAVPFGRLGLRAGDLIRFFVELSTGETSLDRSPREGIFDVTAPSAELERINWQV